MEPEVIVETPRIVWNTPAAVASRPWKDNLEWRLPLDGFAHLRIAPALFSAGIPSVAGALTPKEDAIGLLMLAAEVEHALMAQYLYAAQSLRGPAAGAVSHVAVQEMGHLITVQNLILSLNGVGADGLPSGLHLGRDTLRRASERNPMPLVLEPVSADSLAKFVVVERPHAISNPEVVSRVAVLEARAAALGVTVNPVYALYAAIRWIFQPDDGEENGGLSTDLGFRPGWHLADADFAAPALIDRFASEPVEWHSIPNLIVLPVRDRTEALAALDAVAAQGEGIEEGSGSHFAVFLDLAADFDTGAVGVKPLPKTPFTPGYPLSEDEGATEITHPYTVLWATLFNQCYELLILDIAWAVSHERGEVRTSLITLCIQTMGDVIQPLARDLAGRPLAEGGTLKAGPPYGLREKTLPDTRVGYRAHFDLDIAELRTAMAAIRARAEFATDTFGKLRLSAIETSITAREPHLPQGA